MRSTGQPVERLEIDRPLQPREHAEDALAFGELAVRDGDAVADAGRAQPLALQHRVEDFARRQARDRAARSLISCSACFLPLTRSAAMTASGVRRSVSDISNSKLRTCRRGRTSRRLCERAMSLTGALMRIEPADRAVARGDRRYSRASLPACWNTSTGAPVRSSSATAEATERSSAAASLRRRRRA